MDRGLVVGGALICASFLIAVALNQSDRDAPEKLPKNAIEAPIVESNSTTPSLDCPKPDEKGLSSNPEQVVPGCK